MSMNHKLSEAEKIQILELKNQYSYGYIGSYLSLKKDTVRKFVLRTKIRKSIMNLRSSGRPRKAFKVKRLENLIKNEPTITLTEILRKLRLNVSRRTLSRRLHEK